MANRCPFNAAAQAIRPVVDERMMIVHYIDNNIKAVIAQLQNDPAQQEVLNILTELKTAVNNASMEFVHISESFDSYEEDALLHFNTTGVQQYFVPIGVKHAVQHSNYILHLLAQFLHIQAVNEAINPDNIPLNSDQLQHLVQELNSFANICDNVDFELEDQKPADNYLPW